MGRNSSGARLEIDACIQPEKGRPCPCCDPRRVIASAVRGGKHGDSPLFLHRANLIRRPDLLRAERGRTIAAGSRRSTDLSMGAGVNQDYQGVFMHILIKTRRKNEYS